MKKVEVTVEMLHKVNQDLMDDKRAPKVIEVTKDMICDAAAVAFSRMRRRKQEQDCNI